MKPILCVFLLTAAGCLAGSSQKTEPHRGMRSGASGQATPQTFSGWLAGQPRYVGYYVRNIRPATRDYYIQRGPCGSQEMARQAGRYVHALRTADRAIDRTYQMLDEFDR
jgi:hypothetical protein